MRQANQRSRVIPAGSRVGIVSLAAILALFISLSETAALAGEPVDTVLSVACKPPYDDPGPVRDALGGPRVLAHDVAIMAGKAGRSETTYLLADGRTLEINRLYPGGRLRRIGIEISDSKPLESVSADAECRVIEGRRLGYDPEGRPDRITVLAADLSRVVEAIPLNPLPPAGTDPGGVSVGLIDSGVNYTLDPLKARLARTADGGLDGYDFWDMDGRPFDSDTGRSPFFPLHHGSAVMSVLIREAPMSRVLPIRYPRPDMTRMAAAVDWLAERGIRIVNLAMGSNKQGDWAAFAEAAARHPRMLFVVSAGNDGRDIDREPVYPAALGLSNALVVTSSEMDGRLAQGSNWGPRSVDIMVPGERIEVKDHRGAPGKASGSSFAVPRVTALAVRLLAKYPDWHGPELRQAILARARTAGDDAGRVRYGWIPDPADGP